MTDKTVNYSDEAVARMLEVYDGDATDEVRKAQIRQLADELAKKEASIRAKLTHLKVYVTLTKAPKGVPAIRKAQLVQAIADEIDADVDVVGSLEKATKVALAKVLIALRAS